MGGTPQFQRQMKSGTVLAIVDQNTAMTAPFLLHEHPLRQRLNNELHARPPMSLAGPAQITP